MSQNLKHKILTQEETPKYSFRKYSFGLASALIGLTAFSGGVKGTIAKADTVSNSAVADQKDIDAKQNNKQATLDISYSDDQKQAQDSNKSVAENKNDNQVSTEQKQVANVQAKNDSQVSHNENNESKEPAVTVKKQATAQRTNSNPVKEEQESKQVVTKSQENTNTSTATKQVKNNETSATIANAIVNNGENRSAVAPKADEQSITITYVDDDEKGQTVGSPVTITGKTGQTVATNITAPENYNLSTLQNPLPKQITFTDKAIDPIIVHLKHQTEYRDVTKYFEQSTSFSLSGPYGAILTTPSDDDTIDQIISIKGTRKYDLVTRNFIGETTWDQDHRHIYQGLDAINSFGDLDKTYVSLDDIYGLELSQNKDLEKLFDGAQAHNGSISTQTWLKDELHADGYYLSEKTSLVFDGKSWLTLKEYQEKVDPNFTWTTTNDSVVMQGDHAVDHINPETITSDLLTKLATVDGDDRWIYLNYVPYTYKHHSAKRTINIHLPNGEVKTITQNADAKQPVFTVYTYSDARNDKSASQETGNWTSGEWAEYDAPVVAGYTAGQPTVSAKTVTGDTQNETIDITYVANDQNVTINYVDANGKNVGTQVVSGKIAQTANINYQAPANWHIVGNAPASYTFKADGNDPITVTVAHNLQDQADQSKTVTRTVTINVPNGSPIVKNQSATFTRHVQKDLVDGSTVYGNWDKSSAVLDAVDIPAVAGYTVNGSANQIAVTPDSQDQNITINYVANGQTSSYYFVDDDGNGQKVGEDHQISGKTDQTINFTVAAPANYELVNAQDANQSYTFKADGNTPVVIHLKHHRASATGAKNKDVDDHRTIIREIDIVSPDGKQTVERQTVEFTRPATEDMVTGQITYGDWSDGGQKQMPALTLPDKSGYHADITVPALTVTPDSKPEPVKVTYVASDQAVKLSFVDRSGAVVGTKTINGKTDQTYNVSLSDLPAHYEIDGSLPVYKFTDQADQALTVHVKQNKDDYTAIAQQITVKHGETPNASDGIKNTQDMPSGTSYAWGTEPQLPQGKTYGDTTGTVVVTFPDGSNENVTVPVHFNSEAEDNAKKGDQAVAFNGTKTYYHGQAVADLTLNDLTNADNVKSVVWANKPDTSKIGNGADSATVTFNDGTTTVINGNYTVTPNDSDKTGTIETQPITVKHGQDPASTDPKDGIKTALPDGTQVNWTSKPALPSGQTYGDTKGTAEVDFPDGSKQSVEITVHVNSDAEDNQNKSQHGEGVAFNGTKTYYHGENVPDLTLNDLTNADNVKSVVWANKPDTSKIGSGADTATVTFNDGTTTVINGNYTVTPNDSDKTGTIETQPITVKHGQDPASVDPKDGIKTTLPDGTKVNWTTKPALPSGQTYGDTKGTAEVDFPDGSKQSVEIPVHVNSDAEDNKSKGDQGVSLKVTDKVYYHGENVPDLTLNDLINADNVKSVVWANKPDTSKIGAGSDSATVTFNDGTTATVGGSYVVNPNDSDKTGTIETQPITVKHGQDPASIDPKEGIKTKLPDGTKVDWTAKPELPNGKTYGDTKGTAEVDFPDGSKQSVEIPVHFNSQAEDNAKKGDQGVGFKNPSQVYSHNQTVPDLTLNDLNNPDNVKSVVWANKPDTSKTGAGTDSATVTFNDGSTVTIKGSYVVNSIDATDLSKAIKDGQDAQKTTKYTNGSDKAKKDLDDALNKGIKDINNPDLSQDQADKDAKDIEDAIKNLDGKATDTTNLDKAIKDGKDAQKTVHYDNSSDKAKKDLDDAINKAVKDKKNPNLSQDQADKDAKDIEDAIKNLDGKATDTSNLNKAIKDGQNAQKSDKYKNSTSKAQKTLDDAINKAINDLKNPNLTQKQADQDARAIEDAIKGLDGKANNNKQSQGTKTNTKTDGNGVVQASTIGDKTNSNELPQTGENNNTIALASGIATALTAGIGMLAEGKKRKRE